METFEEPDVISKGICVMEELELIVTFWLFTVPFTCILNPELFFPEYSAMANKAKAVVWVLYQLSCESFAAMVFNRDAPSFRLSIRVNVSKTIASSRMWEPKVYLS